jgi:acetate kinase
VINSGSSSIKFQLFDMGEECSIANGNFERLGEQEARLKFSLTEHNCETETVSTNHPGADHAEGFSLITALLRDKNLLSKAHQLQAVGHRVVHGGEQFQQPEVITPEVLAGIRAMIPLAPIHNPANLKGIEITLEQLPNIPQVAVFDTAFHQTLPEYAYTYAIPYHLYQQQGIRRYGFHGSSHAFVAQAAAQFLARPVEALNLITLHLGNGASAAAIRHGQCIDTSMGLTPLEGLIMGTRCGDLDPSIIFYIHKQTGLSFPEIEQLLNQASGLEGIAGVSDMRQLMEHIAHNDKQARLALDMFCYRIKKYIGAYNAILGRVDAIVFTGGIGEHASQVREQVCTELEHLGIMLDAAANQQAEENACAIHLSDSKVAILVIQTNEELEIARQTMKTVFTSY